MNEADAPEPDDTESETSANPQIADVPAVVRKFTDRIAQIENCAAAHISMALLSKQSRLQTTLREVFTLAGKQIPKMIGGNEQVEVTYEEYTKIAQIIGSSHDEIIAEGLFILGFSTFDAFIGNLLRAIFSQSPELIYKLEEKAIKVGDFLKCKTIEEAVEKLIDRDISSLLRDSYDEQFTKIANRHGLNTIKAFESWPKFIEAAQRRNLITHCNGIVSQQYLSECLRCEFKIPDNVIEGTQLKISGEYLQASLDVLYEVGLKLAHTLWRKTCPNQIEKSEKALTDEGFKLLQQQKFSLAKTIGLFAIGLPNAKSDLQSKISRINCAQAIKWSGDKPAALKILNNVEWSGSIRDLRLAVEVLRENYSNAADLMREIGKKGELVLRVGYETWPVFREFRETTEFKNAFREIYGDDPGVVNNVAFASPESNNDLQPNIDKEIFAMPSEQPVEKNSSDSDSKRELA
ncbi:hypothetical protein [Schlesneria paludicola]|uniref:hypothetical protein n=1 Tax=Schlesneria paludicola TaxID=360056 RepID=UPI00029A4DE0|nr:hypothetical protein [Schlesneria paludicola]